MGCIMKTEMLQQDDDNDDDMMMVVVVVENLKIQFFSKSCTDLWKLILSNRHTQTNRHRSMTAGLWIGPNALWSFQNQTKELGHIRSLYASLSKLNLEDQLWLSKGSLLVKLDSPAYFSITPSSALKPLIDDDGRCVLTAVPLMNRL